MPAPVTCEPRVTSVTVLVPAQVTCRLAASLQAAKTKKSACRQLAEFGADRSMMVTGMELTTVDEAGATITILVGTPEKMTCAVVAKVRPPLPPVMDRVTVCALGDVSDLVNTGGFALAAMVPWQGSTHSRC